MARRKISWRKIHRKIRRGHLMWILPHCRCATFWLPRDVLCNEQSNPLSSQRPLLPSSTAQQNCCNHRGMPTRIYNHRLNPLAFQVNQMILAIVKLFLVFACFSLHWRARPVHDHANEADVCIQPCKLRIHAFVEMIHIQAISYIEAMWFQGMRVWPMFIRMEIPHDEPLPYRCSVCRWYHLRT